MCILKTLVYFSMEGLHSTVPDALASYKSKYKFHFNFSLKIENCKFQ